VKASDAHTQEGGVAISAAQPLTMTLSPPLDVAAVFDAHGDLMFRHLQRLGVREADVSDALQDALLVIHRRLGDYDTSRPIEPWLYGICVKIAASYRRRAHVRRERPTELVAEQADEHGVDPEAHLASREARARLDALLDRLDPERRAVLVMFELEEMPCDRIASLLGVPVGTVYSRLHAARRELERVVRRRSR
jgi:RNA polymerase sigma-70 factor (ECF subfamily)